MDALAADVAGDEEEGVEPAQPRASKPAKKPLYLREVQAAQLLAGGASDGEEEEEGAGTAAAAAAAAALPPSYAEEQAKARREFMAAAEAAGEDAPLELKVKAHGAGDGAGDGAPPPAARTRKAKLLQSLSSLPPPDSNAAADAFLADYIAHERWKGGDDDEGNDSRGADADGGIRGLLRAPVDGGGGGGGGGGDSDDSAEAVEGAEAFEAAWNFRFEEPGSSALATAPRRLEGLVRKAPPSRGAARVAKAERTAARKAELRSELARLRALKRADIESKLRAIRAVGGLRGAGGESLGAYLDADEWAGGDAHDAAMASLFGEGYYGGEEEAGDAGAAGEGEGEEEEEGEEGEEEEEKEGGGAKRGRKATRRSSRLRKPAFGDIEEELRSLLRPVAAGGGGAAAAVARAEAERAAGGGAQPEGDGGGDGGGDGDGDDEPGGAGGEAGAGGGSQFGKRAMKKWRRRVFSPQPRVCAPSLSSLTRSPLFPSFPTVQCAGGEGCGVPRARLRGLCGRPAHPLQVHGRAARPVRAEARGAADAARQGAEPGGVVEAPRALPRAGGAPEVRPQARPGGGGARPAGGGAGGGGGGGGAGLARPRRGRGRRRRRRGGGGGGRRRAQSVLRGANQECAARGGGGGRGGRRGAGAGGRGCG